MQFIRFFGVHSLFFLLISFYSSSCSSAEESDTESVSSGVSGAQTLGLCEDDEDSYGGHEDHFKTKFYNVGQGNCVLVTCPNKEDQKTSFLVDCGSSEHDNTKRREKPPIDRDSIFKNISESVRGRDIIIVITHLDKDHYNWIKPMIDAGNIPVEKIKKIVVGFGGGWSTSATDGDEKALRELLEEPTIKDRVSYVGLTERVDLPICGDRSPGNISANAYTRARRYMIERGQVSTTPRNKNDDSIVLRFDFENCSTVIPGDAEKYTTDYISKDPIYGPRFKKDTTVLMAAHHGSMSHDANDVTWLRKLSPKIGIFSAGDHGGFKHPKCYTVGSFLDPDRRGYRSIWGLERENDSSCFGAIGRTQTPALKGRALFNTFDVGDITIVFKKEDAEKEAYVCLYTKKGGKIIRGTSCSFGVYDKPRGGYGFSSPQKVYNKRERLLETEREKMRKSSTL